MRRWRLARYRVDVVYLLMKNRTQQSPRTSFVAVGIFYVVALADVFQLIAHWAFIDQLGPWLVVLGIASVVALVAVATVVLIRTLITVRHLKQGGVISGS
ncbi:hypothetical protein DVJ78_16585 [Humibacter sp. BT305]|nr:hypothetical protein DVJ78_16585 [Humibacter sp. BT305]